MKTNRFFWSLTSLLILASMILSACGGGAATPAPAPEQPQQPAAEVPAAEEPAAEVPANLPPVGPELAEAYAGKFKGTVVTMAGPFVDNDAVKFEQSIAAFEQATGIDIRHYR